jgi:hypothetical protein
MGPADRQFSEDLAKHREQHSANSNGTIYNLQIILPALCTYWPSGANLLRQSGKFNFFFACFSISGVKKCSANTVDRRSI